MVEGAAVKIDGIYTWPDGSFVSAVVDHADLSRVTFRVEGSARAVWFGLNEDDPGVLHPLAMSTYADREECYAELQSKLLGFALDLDVRRPWTGTRSSLAYARRGEAPALPYPRWVEDPVRWEGRYDEADRHVLRQVARRAMLKSTGLVDFSSEWQSTALNEDLYLGYVDRLQILPPLFYVDDTWHATCSGQTGDPTSRYFHGLVDQLLDLELILPSSSRRAWEAEHVERGSWVLPNPDEVEVFRLLGEQIPWLWPPRRLDQWLQSQP